RRVKVEGTTNLPENTEFIITVAETTPGFVGQSKCKVRANGTFETETFGTKTGLSAGLYSAEVMMPFTCFQPPDVQKATGSKGENLTGPLVSERKDVVGVTVRAMKEFSISGP